MNKQIFLILFLAVSLPAGAWEIIEGELVAEESDFLSSALQGNSIDQEKLAEVYLNHENEDAAAYWACKAARAAADEQNDNLFEASTDIMYSATYYEMARLFEEGKASGQFIDCLEYFKKYLAPTGADIPGVMTKIKSPEPPKGTVITITDEMANETTSFMRSETGKILTELKLVPVKEYEKNMRLYQRLTELNPDNKHYKSKFKFYKGKLAEKMEKDERWQVDCKKHIEIYSANEVARELNMTETWILQNYKVNIWTKQSVNGKGRVVGHLLPGSRALIIAEGAEDYKIKSPLDGSVGWINKIQVKETLIQNSKTFEPCR